MIRTMLGEVNVIHLPSFVPYRRFLLTLSCIEMQASCPSVHFRFSCFLRKGLLLTLVFTPPFASSLVPTSTDNLANTSSISSSHDELKLHTCNKCQRQCYNASIPNRTFPQLSVYKNAWRLPCSTVSCLEPPQRGNHPPQLLFAFRTRGFVSRMGVGDDSFSRAGTRQWYLMWRRFDSMSKGAFGWHRPLSFVGF